MTPSVKSDPVVDSFLSDVQPKAEPVVETPVIETPEVTPPVAEIPKVEPVVTPPIAEVPKIEPVTPPIAETPQPNVDVAKIFEEASGGRIKTVEDLKKIIEENTTLSQKIEEAPKFGDYTMKFDAWIKKGLEPELFHIIHDLPLDEMSAEEKVKASLKLQNQEWSKEDVDLYVKHTYGLMDKDEEGYNEQNVKVGKLKLQQDSKAHETELRKLQEMTLFSDADEKEAVKLEGERQVVWKTNLPSLVNDFSKISFPLDEKSSFDFVLTSAQLQSAMSSVLKSVLSAPVSYDVNGINAVKNHIKTELINQNFNQILRAATSQQKTIDIEKEIVESHNPSGAVTPEVPPVVEKDKDEIIFETMMSALR